NVKGELIERFNINDNPVEFASFSPDGKNIITICPSNKVQIWDLHGNVVEEFKWHDTFEWNVWDARYSHRTKLFDQLGNEIDAFKWHSSFVNSAELSPSGDFVITASEDSTAKLWDLQGIELVVFKGHEGSVIDASINYSEKTVVTAGSDRTIRIWDMKGNELKKIDGFDEDLRYAIFQYNNIYIQTQSYGDTIRIWSLEGDLIDSGHWSRFYRSSIFFSPNGKYFVTAVRFDGPARLWNIASKKATELDYASFATFSPDGNTIITNYGYDKACLWDLNGNRIQIFEGHTDLVINAMFSPDGKFIITSSNDNTVRLWDLNGNEIIKFNTDQKKITYAAISPDGRYIIASDESGSIQSWLIDPKEMIRKVNNDFNSGNVWQLDLEEKKKYNIVLSNEDNFILAAQRFKLFADSTQEYSEKINHYKKAIQNYKNSFDVLETSNQQYKLRKIKKKTSEIYQELVYRYLLNKEFEKAIIAANEGLYLNMANGHLQIYLATAYLYNDQYNEAEMIFIALKGKPFTSSDNLYNELIFNVFSELENGNINHEDVFKIRVILNLRENFNYQILDFTKLETKKNVDSPLLLLNDIT
ncbi:MAG: WD40 repeat domain-containing protein, partial [Nitrosopumilus sp.]